MSQGVEGQLSGSMDIDLFHMSLQILTSVRSRSPITIATSTASTRREVTTANVKKALCSALTGGSVEVRTVVKHSWKVYFLTLYINKTFFIAQNGKIIFV